MEPTASDLKLNINGSTTNWFVGDSVLAPISGDGKLSEATIKSISTDENGENLALLRFSNFNEEIVPITRLQKKKKNERWKGFIFDDEDLEKPFFNDKMTLGPKISLKLCEGGIYVPHTINRYLRDYQRDGIQFICKHYFCGNGCILGDDMGLGKTVQVISFLAAVLHKTGTREDIENNMPEFVLKTMRKESKALNDKIFLVIAPLSVLYNWKNELDTWGYFRVYILHGNKKDHAFSCIRRNKCEIALSTYETVRLCLDDINSIEWSAVFVDEAHKIKNPKAQITQALKALKCKVRIGLTGTILQNNMDELWCVMDWAIPGCLGSRARFKEDFGNPIEFGQRHGATKRELAVGRKSVRQLAKHMSFWFLRRTKSLISDQLPRKEDRVVYCSLTEFQKSVYKAVLETEDIKLVMHGWDPCDCNSGRKRKNCCYKCNREGSTVRQIYFSYLAVLRKISNHVALLQPNENTSKMQQSTVRRVCEHVFNKFPEFVEQSKEAAFATISDPKYSGKMKVLQRLLDHFRRNKDKVLLFSFSTKLLDVLERHCMATGLDYRRLDGKTKTEERVKIVKEFNSLQDINICLVSTMAGGLGLNFVGANVVIMFDPTWNPANDLQAIDRAYRIGQCRDVQVFRLISLGTVEEIMYLRQLYKQQLHCAAVGSENARRYFNAVQGSKEHPGEIFGVRNLFSLHIGGSCLTRDIIQREGQVEAGVMTAITQLREEPLVERQEAITNGNTTEEANLNLVQPNKENRAALRKSEQFFDFSSDSETEPSMKKTKIDPVEINHHRDTGGQLTLVQCGFARFFDRKGSSSEESSESDYHFNIEILQKQSTGTGTSLGAAMAQGKVGYRAQDSRLNAQTVKGDGGHSKQVKHNYNSSTESEGKAEPLTDMRVNNSRDENNVVSISGVFRQKKKMLVKRKSHLSFLSTDSEDSSNEDNSCTKKALSSKILDCLDAKSSIIDGSPKMTQGKTLSHVAKLKTQLNKKESITDESDDIEVSTESPDVMSSPPDDSAEAGRRNVKNKSGAIVKKVTAQYNIEEFSSSEDDITTKRSRVNTNDEISRNNRGKKCKKVQLGTHNRPSENAKDLTVPKYRKWRQNHKEQLASVSKLLGDVEEVAFIHSNQCVVGSSKAENQMTHTAIRDVFELKQYSQVPANITCYTVQTDGKGQQAAGTSTLIRDAPTGICRKQLSGLAPVENLPDHALINTLQQQPKMLRGSSLTQCSRSNNIQPVRPPEAELEDNVTVQRSKSYASTCHSDREANKTINFICGASAGRIRSLRKKNLKEMAQCFEMQDEVNSQKHDYMSGQPHKKHNVMADKSASDFAEGIGDRISMGCSSPSTAAVSKSRLDGIGTSSKGAVKPQQQFEERGSPADKPKCTPDNTHKITQLKTDSITELLGDTSILDPLFNRNKNLTAKPKKAAGEVPKRKIKPKDFWDFLNKSNEEYATTLTDFSVIERLCERAPLKSKGKETEWDGSLWKKNEKFLWKKT